MPRKTCTTARYFFPFDASRKIASLRRFASPSEANFGIGEPGLTHDGHLRWRIWKSIPRRFVPMSVKSGAPRFEEPVPRYVWQAVQPELAKSFAPATACGLFANPSRFAHVGTAWTTSLASASFAVAPL